MNDPSLPGPMSRRQVLALAAAGALLPMAARAAPAGRITDPAAALKALKDGNARYVQWLKTSAARRGDERRAEVSESQYPYAVIMGCADSRVAPEVLFDAGIGDLFVVRVAGNLVDPSDPYVMGSLEYAVGVLNAPLILVLGHTRCGAVDAAKKTIEGDGELPGSIEKLVDAIRPAVRAAKGRPGDPLQEAIDENVRLGVKRLKGSHPILAPAASKGALQVVGGVYDLRTGEVRYLD